jgi:prepilin-type N-terminal cleavage/methylation domain-containing protein
MNERIRAERGFTLVEMIMTVAIVGVLASAAMPLASLVSQRSKEQELRQSLLQIREAIDAYRREVIEGSYGRGRRSDESEEEAHYLLAPAPARSTGYRSIGVCGGDLGAQELR